MSLIKQSLSDLIDNVGSAAIDCLPGVETIEAGPQSELKGALEFKILYGTRERSRDDDSPQNIYIYLTTFHGEKKHHELTFAIAGDDADGESESLRAEDVVRIVSERSPAFEHATTADKIRSLARYYFLLLLHEWNYDDKALKTPFIISNTLVRSLRFVCKDFEERKKTPSLPQPVLSSSPEVDSPYA